MDGLVNLATEYQGAEQMVIRYSDGKNAADGVVYLINAGSTNFPILHLATSTLGVLSSLPSYQHTHFHSR